eukprot:766879-Hanusia_phi.AAC.2
MPEEGRDALHLTAAARRREQGDRGGGANEVQEEDWAEKNEAEEEASKGSGPRSQHEGSGQHVLGLGVQVRPGLGKETKDCRVSVDSCLVRWGLRSLSKSNLRGAWKPELASRETSSPSRVVEGRPELRMSRREGGHGKRSGRGSEKEQVAAVLQVRRNGRGREGGGGGGGVACPEGPTGWICSLAPPPCQGSD